MDDRGWADRRELTLRRCTGAPGSSERLSYLPFLKREHKGTPRGLDTAVVVRPKGGRLKIQARRAFTFTATRNETTSKKMRLTRYYLPTHPLRSVSLRRARVGPTLACRFRPCQPAHGLHAVGLALLVGHADLAPEVHEHGLAVLRALCAAEVAFNGEAHAGSHRQD